MTKELKELTAQTSDAFLPIPSPVSGGPQLTAVVISIKNIYCTI